MAQFGFGNSVPTVVKNLLIANGLVFLAQFLFANQGFPLEPLFALWPIGDGFRVWQLVTHMFMHGGIWHILFNMLGLWMFGSVLENFWGPKRFLQFYIVCGLAAGLTQLFFVSYGYTIGASGAIMGIFAGFAYLFPESPLYLYFIPIPIKAKWAMPGLILVDVFGAIAPREGDNTAHWAHIGGALAGLALVYIWNRTNRKTFY